MKILVELTYYRPHTSGLTIYAERLARALVKKGHIVTVLTSQFDPTLPREEIMSGVRVVRVPVLFRISKGVVMPTFGLLANKLVREHDVIHLHLPQLDAAGLALRGKLFKKPTVITYHCDLQMPKGILSRTANHGVNIMNHIAGFFTDRIVTYTQDYADHSKFINRFKEKVMVINPPVELPATSKKDISEFRRKHNRENMHPIIGMAARLASEKGVEVLLNAMEKIITVFPKTQVWFAGPYIDIVGEENYLKRLLPLIQKYQISGNWKFLGLLSRKEMANFYPNLDILTVPSLNSTEAFGLVQIEAMMNRVPCIASNLPGVRQPIIRHGMGEVITIGSSVELSEAVIKIMANKGKYIQGYEKIKEQYEPSVIADEYIQLFNEITSEIQRSSKT
ncbi:MAG: glycosyltransferase family 4 protein [Anaerolineaceae bacterium]|nr:glycosyltransferase family 4 protein [Anaerolineaceae bacterium]